jgi:hypothetical protein
MEQIVLPSLYCPFPSRLNTHVETAQQHIVEWVQRFELVTGDTALKRFKAAKFAWLAARAYPTAPLEELLVVADWNVWLFIHDDQCDEAGIGRQPAQLAQLYERLCGILCDEPPLAMDTALAHGLYDLWQRMHQISSAEWRKRFFCSVDNYFESCVWEAENRAVRRVPDIATYIRMRPFAGALNTDVELIEPCEHIYLPNAVHVHPVIKNLTLICNNIVCWSNDIISLEKERQSGDIHNLVIAVRHERHYSWQEAVDCVAEMHNAEVHKFVQLAQQLPRFGADTDAELVRYVVILRAWMRGNLDWAFDTGRYGKAHQAYVI